MKILWLSHFAPYPPKGGALQRSYNMLKQLSDSAEIHLLSLAPYSKAIAFYESYQIATETYEKELVKICSEVKLIPHGRFNRKTTKILNGVKSLFSKDAYDVIWLHSTEFAEHLKKLLQTTTFDAIHVDTIGLFPYVEKTNLPLIQNHHNIESDMLFQRAEMVSWPFGLYMQGQACKLRNLESKAGKKVELNITCSELDSRRLRSTGIENIECIPNGVDLSYFTRSKNYLPERQINLIFAGGLEWYPNREAMLFLAKKIWPKLSSVEPNATMNVIGKGSINLLNKLAEKDENFNVAGFVPDIRPHLENASIYICPIRNGGGTKLKVLDALAMGIPLVAHPVACEGIDVIDGEHVIIAETADDFVSAVTKLASTPELALSLSRNGRILMEKKYCYEKIGRQLSTSYHNLINKGVKK